MRCSSTKYAISWALTCPRRSEPSSSASNPFPRRLLPNRKSKQNQQKVETDEKTWRDWSSRGQREACTNPLHDGESLIRGSTTYWLDARIFSQRAVNWNLADCSLPPTSTPAHLLPNRVTPCIFAA